MSTTHVDCEVLSCTREAVIRKLYVEDFECADSNTRSKPEKRIISSTGDESDSSLVNCHGRVGFECGKLKRIRAGQGFKVNSYDTHLELRACLKPRPLTNIADKVLLDESTQQMFNLRAGCNIQLTKHGNETIEISASTKPTSTCEKDTTSLVTDTGFVTGVRGKDGVHVAKDGTGNITEFSMYKIKSSNCVVTYNDKSRSIQVDSVPMQNAKGPGCNLISNCGKVAKCINFSPPFVVTDRDKYITVDLPVAVVNSIPSKTGALVNPDGRTIKTLECGKGIKMSDTENSLTIESWLDPTLLSASLKSKSLNISQEGMCCHLELKHPVKSGARANGDITIMEESQIATLKSGRGIALAKKGDCIEIGLDQRVMTCAGDAATGAGILCNDGLRRVVGKGGITARAIGPYLYIESATPTYTSEGGARLFNGDFTLCKPIVGDGRISVLDNGKNLALTYNGLKNSPGSGYQIVDEKNYVAKRFAFDSHFDVVDRQNVVRVSLKHNSLFTQPGEGTKLYENDVLKTIRVSGAIQKQVRKDCVTLHVPEPAMESCQNVDGVSVLKDPKTLKRIHVCSGLEVVEHRDVIHITARRLEDRIVALENKLVEMSKSLDIVNFIAASGGKFTSS